jgi:DNA invertase Pin-like site-specific DNA recombinase
MSLPFVQSTTSAKIVTLAEGLQPCEEISLDANLRCFIYSYYNSDTTQKNVKAYIRCSTDMQVEDGTSLQVQRSRIVKYCDEKKYNIQTIYEDRGISGAKGLENRLSLKKLLDDVVKDDIVMVTEIDRLSRDFNFLSDCEVILKKKKASLEVVGLGKNVLERGSAFMFHILASIGEEERRMISERVKASTEYAKKMGTYKLKPAFGMKSPGYKEPNVQDEKEMEVVEFIRSYRKTNPLIPISTLMKDLDILYPVETLKESCGKRSCVKWYYNKVRTIMKNYNIQ